MLAYDKTLLDNTRLVSEAAVLEKVHVISKEQLRLIEQLPSYPQMNILVRLGLFALGCFLFSSCSSILSVFTFVAEDSNFGAACMVNAIFGFAALEFIIRKWKYFGNGMDNAFLYCAELSLIASIAFFIAELDHLNPLFFISGLVGLLCSYRYVDQFSAFIACLGTSAFVLNGVFSMSPALHSFLPFIAMLLAALFYGVCTALKQVSSEIYSGCLTVGWVFSLVLFYVSGNYFVVREFSDVLIDSNIGLMYDLPMAFVFYALTGLVPLAYVYLGLKQRNRRLLWLGILCTAASVFTVRYYYHVVPLEIALILSGLLLFAIAFFAMKKLKGKTSGLTFKPDHFSNADLLDNAEILLLLQRYAVKPLAPDAETTEFGGGEFSGGGSGNKF